MSVKVHPVLCAFVIKHLSSCVVVIVLGKVIRRGLSVCVSVCLCLCLCRRHGILGSFIVHKHMTQKTHVCKGSPSPLCLGHKTMTSCAVVIALGKVIRKGSCELLFW